MLGVSSTNGKSTKLAWFVSLALVALLAAACAAPTGGSSSGQAPAAQPPTNAPLATEMAATSAPAATEIAATSAPAPAEAPAATMPPAATEAPAAAGSVSFSKDVMPIFQATCVKCHGGSDGVKGDLSMKTYADLMKGGEHGAAIVPGDAASSLLVKQIVNGKMPKRGPKLPQAQIDLISQWVAQGAQDN